MISRSRSESPQRHLKELLSEDQEPFQLTSYIADHKKCHLKKQITQQRPQTLHLKKKLLPKQNASFPAHFCRNACFFSNLQVDSPEYFKKSPLLSPASLGSKSPSRAMLLHVPAKTAALLLDAACRIHKNSSSKLKPKPQPRNSGLGLFGSVIKRLTNRTRTRKLETGDPKEAAGGDEDVIRWADSVKRSASAEIRVGSEAGSGERSDLAEDQTGFSNGRLSSVWSEENKSIASSSSSTCCSRSASGNLSEEEVDEKIGFVNALDNQIDRNIGEDFTFCLSPLSPFRFALQKSPSPGPRSPAFCSPAASPSRRKFQEHVSCEQQDPSVEFQVEDEEEEEEKEQCSPVSILDPPFGDDDCEEEEADCGDDEDEFDMECSYAFVQRAKQQLLQKLRKFEKLAELDPIELEKRMVEEEDEDEEELEYEADDDYEDDDLSSSVDTERSMEGYLVEIGRESGLVKGLVNPVMKRLLSDLIIEEEKIESSEDRYESIVKKVCKRLESWKEVEPNTIEMMVAKDLKGENDMWKKPREEISQTAKVLELSIFAALLEELLDELIVP